MIKHVKCIAVLFASFSSLAMQPRDLPRDSSGSSIQIPRRPTFAAPRSMTGNFNSKENDPNYNGPRIPTPRQVTFPDRPALSQSANSNIPRTAQPICPPTSQPNPAIRPRWEFEQTAQPIMHSSGGFALRRPSSQTAGLSQVTRDPSGYQPTTQPIRLPTSQPNSEALVQPRPAPGAQAISFVTRQAIDQAPVQPALWFGQSSSTQQIQAPASPNNSAPVSPRPQLRRLKNQKFALQLNEPETSLAMDQASGQADLSVQPVLEEHNYQEYESQPYLEPTYNVEPNEPYVDQAYEAEQNYYEAQGEYEAEQNYYGAPVQYPSEAADGYTLYGYDDAQPVENAQNAYVYDKNNPIHAWTCNICNCDANFCEELNCLKCGAEKGSVREEGSDKIISTIDKREIERTEIAKNYIKGGKTIQKEIHSRICDWLTSENVLIFVDSLIHIPNQVSTVSLVPERLVKCTGTGAAWGELIEKSRPNLKHLTFQLTEFNPSDLKIITDKLRYNNSLITINLFGNRLEDAGFTIAKIIKTNPTLKELRLADTGINDLHVGAIAQALMHNKTLRVLDLSSSKNNEITENGLKALKLALKHHNTTLMTLVLSGDSQLIKDIQKLLDKNAKNAISAVSTSSPRTSKVRRLSLNKKDRHMLNNSAK